MSSKRSQLRRSELEGEGGGEALPALELFLTATNYQVHDSNFRHKREQEIVFVLSLSFPSTYAFLSLSLSPFCLLALLGGGGVVSRQVRREGEKKKENHHLLNDLSK